MDFGGVYSGVAVRLSGNSLHPVLALFFGISSMQPGKRYTWWGWVRWAWVCFVGTQALCPSFSPLLWCSSWNHAWCVNPARVLVNDYWCHSLKWRVAFSWCLSSWSWHSYLFPSLQEGIWPLLFLPTSLSPDLGREGSQLESGIQDLFPFHIKNLDKTFTDGLCRRAFAQGKAPCPLINGRFLSMEWPGLSGQRKMFPVQAVSHPRMFLKLKGRSCEPATDLQYWIFSEHCGFGRYCFIISLPASDSWLDALGCSLALNPAGVQAVGVARWFPNDSSFEVAIILLLFGWHLLVMQSFVTQGCSSGPQEGRASFHRVSPCIC